MTVWDMMLQAWPVALILLVFTPVGRTIGRGILVLIGLSSKQRWDA